MTTTTKGEPMDTEFNERVKAALLAGVIEGDGHTLFAPDHYSPHFGVEELTAAGLVQKHKSNFNYAKSTIFGNDGQPLKALEAVYNLDFLYWIARKVGAKGSDSNGRGSQAHDLVSHISWVVNVSDETKARLLLEYQESN